MKKPLEHSDEVRERAVRRRGECRASYPSQWAAIDRSCPAETLYMWARLHVADTGQRIGATTAEAKCAKELGRENKSCAEPTRS